MPAPAVNSVAQKVDGLSNTQAESIWEEVKKSLREDGEIPDSDEDMTDQDWGLVMDAFLTTIASRFDVNKSDLTETKKYEMAISFRMLSGRDRSRIISELRDRGWLPNEALKNIIVAQSQEEVEQAIQDAKNQVSPEQLSKFLTDLEAILRNMENEVENFLNEDYSSSEFIERYFD